jgi:hypothetical protein
VRAAVEAFRRFASITVDDSAPAHEDGDGVLAQFGTRDFRGVREFSADLTPQFQEPGDQDAPLWQLGCTIYWDRLRKTARLPPDIFGPSAWTSMTSSQTLSPCQAGHGP